MDKMRVAMIDAAMVEMKNLYPPLSRTECARLIDAAWQAAQSAAVPEHIRAIKIPTDAMEQEFQKHYRRGYEAGKGDAQSVPVVGEVVAWRWIRLSTGGPDGGRFFDGTPSDSAIETAANSYIPCAPQLLVIQPATSISAAELDALRKDAAKVLHAEQIRIAAVAAIREVTGCPDIKGKDGAYLVDSVIVNLIEMQEDAAIAGEKK